MYQSGQLVFYGCHGVCAVADIETKIVDKKQVEYYVLESLSHQGTRFYVPVHNKVVAAKLRQLLTAEEWNVLLSDKTLRMDAWIADENRRVAQNREIINRGNPNELMIMVRLLQAHRDAQLDRKSVV